MHLSKQQLRNPMIILAAVALLGPAFAGCVTGDGGDGSASFYVKDAPSDEFKHVNVTFSEVQVHFAGNGSGEDAADEEADGEWITVVDEERTVDLLNFQQEDSRAFLGEANLTAGTYTQIRVTVDDAYGISADDGSREDIVVSSGTVKVVRSFEIAEGEETRVILDIDLDRSLREQGNGQWRMTPVIGKTIVEENPSTPNGDQPDEAGAQGDQADQSSGDGSATADTSQDGMAPMTAYVKDAPTDEFDEIWLEFDTVEVHHAGNGSDENESEENETADVDEDEGNETAGNESGNDTGEDESGNEPLEQQSSDEENETEEDDGRWITVFNGSKEVDLLQFNETGAKAFLGEADVPTGKYTQIRINVTEAWGMQDGNRTDITVSSGTVKVVRPWDVSDNGTIAQVTVDVDLDRSLREQGNGEWRMTPVIGKVLVDHVEDDPRADQPNGHAQSQQGSDDDQAEGQGQGQAGNQSTTTAQQAPQGNASAFVKDAPTDEFDEIWLNISEVRVHWVGNQSNEVNETNTTGNETNETDDTGEWVTLFNGTREVNLLNFSEEGAKAFLGNTTIPVGNYTQIRLNVTDAWGVQNGTETTITLSSDKAMIVRPFEVTENGTTEIVIDVDLDKSLRQQGNDEWRMTPVIGKVLVDHVDEATNEDVPDGA